jgi:PiT family inorganic phosphate transporter
MPETPEILLGLVIVSALAFDFINGFHDTANAIATCISTRALSIRAAIGMAAILNFVGALISTHVATTIGKGIVDPAYVSQIIVLAALFGAIFWDLLTWHYGIPASSSHAIIGGLIGAVVAARGVDPLQWDGISKIVIAIVVSPVTGTIAAYLLMVAIFWVFRSYHPSPLNRAFRHLQVFSAAFMAFSHGSKRRQKSMGIISLALFHLRVPSHLPRSAWVMLACARRWRRARRWAVADHQDGRQGLRGAPAGPRLLRGDLLRARHPDRDRDGDPHQHHPRHLLGDPRTGLSRGAGR